MQFSVTELLLNQMEHWPCWATKKNQNLHYFYLIRLFLNLILSDITQTDHSCLAVRFF